MKRAMSLGLLAVHAATGSSSIRISGCIARRAPSPRASAARRRGPRPGRGGCGRFEKSMMRSSISRAASPLRGGAAEIDQRIEDVGEVGVTTELDVVEHRHAAEQRDVLETARPRPCRLRSGRGMRDVRAMKRMRRTGGPVKAGDGVEQRGFACPFRTDDGGDGPRSDFEAHVGQRLVPPNDNEPRPREGIGLALPDAILSPPPRRPPSDG